MPLDSHGIDLTARASFRHWTRSEIRYCDQDSMGHVNNAVYVSWVELSRVLLIKPFVDAIAPIETVLANLGIDYLRETRFPGDVEIGARWLRVGNRSIVTGFGVFRGDECLVTSVCVNVFFDGVSRRAADPPPEVRAAIRAALAAEPA